MATVMQTEIKVLAELFAEKLSEIVGRHLDAQIDARFEAFNLDSPPVFTEDRIREIATEEAENTVNGATVDISA